MSATLTGLASFLIPIALDFVLKWLKSGQSESALRQTGADEANSKANQESANAQTRMSDANAQPRSRSLAADRLRDGTI